MMYGPESVTVSTSFGDMNKFKEITALLLFWLILTSSGFISTVGSENKNIKSKQEKPLAKGMVRDMYSALTTSSTSYWDTAKSIINQVQMQFFPPNLDFRSRRVQSNSGKGSGERMKEAAKKSFVTSKVGIEESAKSAAGIVGEAVQKTTDKMKERTSGGDKTHAEL